MSRYITFIILLLCVGELVIGILALNGYDWAVATSIYLLITDACATLLALCYLVYIEVQEYIFEQQHRDMWGE